MNLPEKTSAEGFGQHVPGTQIAASAGPAWTDVLVEVYARRRVEESIIVPAVAEPQIVWILSGSARVEEREFNGTWRGREVKAGEFFLTTTSMPYELRWKATSAANFVTMVVYIGLPVFARALEEADRSASQGPVLREIFGETDAALSSFLEQLRAELTTQRTGSALLVQGVAQALAVHLVRTYPAATATRREQRGGLPAFKLRKVTEYLETHLDEDVPLARLAEEVGMSEFYFSRLFKKTTGFLPSHYLIRLRIASARRLLRETSKSMIEIGLQVGYSSPSHFAHIFRREVGVTPSQYRGRE